MKKQIISAKQCIEETRDERNKLKQILLKAEIIARDSHEGQKRKDGKPYIIHPEAVAREFGNYELKDIECKIVAWLHDVIEDTKLEPKDLEERGIPRKLVQEICFLSRQENESYKDYILELKGYEIARKVKIADLKHNLINLNKGSMRDKYLLALHILENEK